MDINKISEQLLEYYLDVAQSKFEEDFAYFNDEIYELIRKIYCIAFLSGVMETYKVVWKNVRNNRHK